MVDDDDARPLVLCSREEAQGDTLDRCEVIAVDPQRVRAVRRQLPDPRETEAAAAIFKLLADPSRCRLVQALVAAGEICVCDLAAALQQSESNVSHHLRILLAHGVVRPRRDGKIVYYAPDDDHVRLLLDLVGRHVQHVSPTHRSAGLQP
jgi:DNA-binding transcriptional ArsR family regulator